MTDPRAMDRRVDLREEYSADPEFEDLGEFMLIEGISKRNEDPSILPDGRIPSAPEGPRWLKIENDPEEDIY